MLYTSPLADLIKRHNLLFHMYADDTQLYSMNHNTNFESKLQQFEECIEDIKKWMDLNKLKLNSEKTESMIVGSRRLMYKINQTGLEVDGTKINFVNNVKNLGVVLESDLSMRSQISSLRRKSFFELKKISSIRNFLSRDATEKIITSLLFSKLDYCNSLLFGTSADNIKRLQVVQNNAARLVLRKRKRDEAKPLLRELHWLPIEKRIEYKIGTVVYKCLNDSAPSYLQELIMLNKPSRNLRSTKDDLLLKIPRAKLNAGTRSFSNFGPTVWNHLPQYVRRAESLEIFKRMLKTYLFKETFLH